MDVCDLRLEIRPPGAVSSFDLTFAGIPVSVAKDACARLALAKMQGVQWFELPVPEVFAIPPASSGEVGSWQPRVLFAEMHRFGVRPAWVVGAAVLRPR